MTAFHPRRRRFGQPRRRVRGLLEIAVTHARAGARHRRAFERCHHALPTLSAYTRRAPPRHPGAAPRNRGVKSPMCRQSVCCCVVVERQPVRERGEFALVALHRRRVAADADRQQPRRGCPASRPPPDSAGRWRRAAARSRESRSRAAIASRSESNGSRKLRSTSGIGQQLEIHHRDRRQRAERADHELAPCPARRRSSPPCRRTAPACLRASRTSCRSPGRAPCRRAAAAARWNSTRSRRPPSRRSANGGSSGTICRFSASSRVSSRQGSPASTLIVRSRGSYCRTRLQAGRGDDLVGGLDGPGHPALGAVALERDGAVVRGGVAAALRPVLAAFAGVSTKRTPRSRRT